MSVSLQPDAVSVAPPLTAVDAPVHSTGHWPAAVPVLRGAMADLRLVEPGDAPALFELLASEEVSRFGTTPPANLAAFERFIEWSGSERQAGRHLCFAVVPHGFDGPVGLFQVRRLDQDSAEWGFALGSAFWGTGLFVEAATLVLDFVFDTLGLHRIEARAVAVNGRGNGALRKLGAVQEGVLRRAFLREGQYVDQVLWSLLDEDWRQARDSDPRPLLVH